MTRVLLIAFGAGLTSSVFYLAFRWGIPSLLALTYLAPVPLVAAGLGWGFAAALVAATVAASTIFIGVDARMAALFLAVSAVPALVVCRYALQSRTDESTGTVEWASSGRTLGALTVYGVILLAFATLYYMGAAGGLESQIRSALRAFFDSLQAGNTARVEFPVDQIARIFAGVMAAFWVSITMIDSILAQSLLARAGLALRPTPSYSALVLPRWMEFALLVALIASFLPGTLGMFGRNAAILLATPFLLLGLAVIHTLSRRIAARLAALTAFYVLMVLLGWYLWALVVLLGLAEQWMSLRERFGAGGGTQENE